MLLVVDVGNTNTVLGVFDLAAQGAADGGALRADWRIETNSARTADEYAVVVRELMALAEIPWGALDAAIVATVVPPVLFALDGFCRRWLKVAPLVVGPGIKTGMPILTENPREVGADRIVNAVAAFERHQKGCIVVDFGTATTFDVVSPKGEYLGGAIAPGLAISADALFHAAAKLPRVELVRPATPVSSTASSSGCGTSSSFRSRCWPRAALRP
jgi:type III pantothenate kinase